ncbi:hypothetical protein ACLOJK_034043 [Asimina triloba]
MASSCDGKCFLCRKSTWAELVNASGDAAKAVIERENTSVRAVIVEEGSFVDAQFRCDRVWVWVDANGDVVRVPKIG